MMAVQALAQVEKNVPKNSTIYIIEDDPAVAETLRRMLEAAGHEAELYATGEAFLDAAEPADGACLVMDVRLPGASGIEVSRTLAERGVNIPTVFLTAAGSVRMAVDAMKAGAVDVLEKPCRENDLLTALHRAFDDGVGAARPALSGDEILARVARLTGREREVLGLLVNGQSNKMMARTLGISPRTVEFYRARIMDKMRTRNVTELVRLSAEAGIVPA